MTVNPADSDIMLWLILKKLDPDDLDMLMEIVSLKGTGHFSDVVLGMSAAIKYERRIGDSATREA